MSSCLSDKFFVGLDLTSVENNGEQRPISRVTLLLDDENSITAGDDTGAELLADCPHATQTMVNAILAHVKGHKYRMFRADDTALDPSAELGDGMTAGEIYSVISRIEDDGSGYCCIAAPGEAELEDEYPSGGPMTIEFNRKIAKTNSRITKTAEQIMLEVSSEIQGLSSSIDIKLDEIVGRVGDTETGLSQTLRIAADGVTITNAEGSTLTINGGQIDARTIKAEQLDASKITAKDLNLTGVISWGDLSGDVKEQVNSAQVSASSAIKTANDLANGQGGGTFINGTTIQAPSVIGGTVVGSRIYFGTGGNVGGLFSTYGFDGVNNTEVVQLGSSYGLVIYAGSNIRMEGNSLWINIDASDIRVKQNGAWVTLPNVR